MTKVEDLKQHLKNLEKQLNGSIKDDYFSNENIINKIAITVIAGYYWARDRDFNNFFDEAEFIKDRKNAIKELEKTYKNKNNLKDVLKEMVNKQAEVVWRRRKFEGIEDPPNSYDRDNWEAKRFIAYLFADKIITDCIESNVCPDFKLNLFDPEIVNLLKSLTIEEYCRIKAYLIFLRNTQSYSGKVYWNDDVNYREATNFLDKAFHNCKCMKKVKMDKNKYSLLLGNIETEKIKKAKKIPCDRIGPINHMNIEKFVDEYYAFFDAIQKNPQEKKEDDLTKIIKMLYDVSYTNVINIFEFMLKCMFLSHINESKHEEIRKEAGKPLKGKPITQEPITQSEPIYA